MSTPTGRMRTRPHADGVRRTAGGLIGPHVPLATEVLAAFGVALALTAAGARLQIDPELRIGQVSILAHQQFAAAVVAIALVGAVLLTGRLGRLEPAARRLAWAGTSGIASGVVGGGAAAALHGTPWPLNAAKGDSGHVLQWAYQALSGTPGAPGLYPPGAVKTLIWTSQIFGWELAPSQKFLQIVGVAIIGPLAYLAWRTVLAPSWAAAVGFASSVPFLDPYKPITSISLVVATPLFVCLVMTLRTCQRQRWAGLLVRSVLLGAALGLIFLGYSGWFVWCAPGVAVAGLAAFPWDHWRRGLAVTASSIAAFAAVSGTYLVATLTGGGVADNYVYFDTSTDPAYFGAWFGDLPGVQAQWPPFGEFGGVGLFTLGLAVGLGAALALGWRSWAVRTTAAMFAGAWVLRFWIAGQMSQTGLVQLYPRTTQVLLHCALICCALALCFALDALVRRASAPSAEQRGWVIGSLATIVLIASSVGSATTDRYMPANDGTVAKFAWVAQHPYSPMYAAAGPDGLVTIELTGDAAPLPMYQSLYCRAYLGAATCP